MAFPREPRARVARERPLGPADYRRLAARIQSMSDPMRLAMLLDLIDGQRSVGVLNAGLGVSMSATSNQLMTLRLAGLVERTRDGTRRLYRLTDAGRALAGCAGWLGRDRDGR